MLVSYNRAKVLSPFVILFVSFVLSIQQSCVDAPHQLSLILVRNFSSSPRNEVQFPAYELRIQVPSSFLHFQFLAYELCLRVPSSFSNFQLHVYWLHLEVPTSLMPLHTLALTLIPL